MKEKNKSNYQKTKINVASGVDTWNQDFDRYNFAIKNLETLKEDEEFKILLAESLFINSIKLGIYEQLLEKIKILNESIDSELKTLNK